MFDIFNWLSSLLMSPVINITDGLEHIPFLYAFFLGIVGAVAPCQLTSNISSITIYGNKSLVDKVPWLHVLLFMVGKILVYSILGTIIWLLGQEVYGVFSQFMPFIRKIIGPLLIVIGLFMLGLIRWRKSWQVFNFPMKMFKDNYIGSFLMGVSFTLAFCPTMFVLFFFTLMPVVMVTSYGAALPAIFGIGTSLPLLVVIFLIWYFGASGAILKKSRKIGSVVQKSAGFLLILIGLMDSLTYWA